MALREVQKTMSNWLQSNHLWWAHSEGINAFNMRMPSPRQSILSNMWENFSPLSLALSVSFIEIIAVTHFTTRRARGSRSLTWFSWEAWFGHSGSDRSGIDSPFALGEGSMPPSLCPRFAEEKQESARETKGSMGTVAPVSLCLWLLLLGGLCLPFWPQVLLPPSLKQPCTFFCHPVFQAVKWRQRCCRFIRWPLTLSLWVPSPLSAEVVCHLHLQKSTHRLRERPHFCSWVDLVLRCCPP